MRGFGSAIVALTAATAGAAQARIVHDGTCPSGYAIDVPGRHTCIRPSRIVHDAKCPSGQRSEDPRAAQCVPVYELERNIHGLGGRPPRHKRIVHD